MYQQIDSKAAALHSSGQDAISDLVDALFEFNGLTRPYPALAASLKHRIIRAELSGPKVSENQVVQATNWLMNELSAPPFAQTSLIQTRVLRSCCLTMMPNLFPDRKDYENFDLNRLLDNRPFSKLSIIQALALLILIFQQKVMNEFFQKIPAEWEPDYIARFIAEQQSNTTEESRPFGLFSRPVSQQRIEMEQLIYEANSKQNEGENLLEVLLDQLGIPR